LVRACCARLPLRYSEQFDPLAISSTEEPTIGDIADDIADIFRDVRNGLWYFDTGRLPDAAWEWAFGFQSHYGRHAAGAVRILHATWLNTAASGWWTTSNDDCTSFLRL
jgi:hypothetical protein